VYDIGIPPPWWWDADDQVIATVLDLLGERAERARAASRRR
jgi:hypothetical protein